MASPARLALRDHAIQAYLEDLLCETDDTAVLESGRLPAVTPAPRPPAPAQFMPARERAAVTTANPAAQTEQSHATQASAAREQEQTTAKSAIPTWAQTTFPAIFFNVAGLRLTVALTELHSVLRCDDITISRIPNQPHWQLGLFKHRKHHVRVLDTRALLGRQATHPEPPSHLLLVAGGSWALACEGIGDVLTLNADGIRWRTTLADRPWLAGTVIKHLCTLVDPQALIRTLHEFR